MVERTLLAPIFAATRPPAITSLLDNVDADLRISCDTLVIPGIETGQGAVAVTLKNGKLLADVAELAVEEGVFRGQFVVERAGNDPRYGLSGKLEGVEAGRLLQRNLGRNPLQGRADIVTGTKQGKYEKAFVSRIYNGLCRWLFGIRVTDLNSVKAYRREVMVNVPLRPDWHRYMVVIAAADGFRLDALPVPLYPRKAGVSKFNWRRIPVGIFDLVSVWFQLRFGRKPMLFFGVVGAMLFLIGLVAGVTALVLRFGYGFGFRPLLNLVETMVISDIVLFGFGLLGEMIAGVQEETREMARTLARLDKLDVRD